MFQEIFGNLDEFGWWDTERLQNDASTQFNPKEFQEGLSRSLVKLLLAEPEPQEINGQVEVAWKTLRTTEHSIMVHGRVTGKYIHFALMYMTDHILPVLPIKYFDQLRHKNWQLEQNLQYQTHMFYYVHMFY